jgi:hypothetical protein
MSKLDDILLAKPADQLYTAMLNVLKDPKFGVDKNNIHYITGALYDAVDNILEELLE